MKRDTLSITMLVSQKY